MERGRTECPSNFLEYFAEFVVDAVDGEPQDGVAKFSQVIVSFGVILLLCLMNVAIHINHETLAGAREIDEIGTDRVLPTKLTAVESMVPEHFPKAPLTGSSPASKIS